MARGPHTWTLVRMSAGCKSLKFNAPYARLPGHTTSVQACTSQQAKSSGFMRNVAVIGAGPAGLACCKELREEGHKVTVFEQSGSVGGTWVLDGESSFVEVAPSVRAGFRSSMYNSLRTNLPRELMSYTCLPFLPAYMAGRSVDPRRYPGHEEVRAYLEAFAEHFDLKQHIQFNNAVTRMEQVPIPVEDSDWVSQSRWRVSTETEEILFDAVVICNGHYSEPYIPDILGADEYPGQQYHSHDYREPSTFAGKNVVIFGTSSSGQDISREVSNVARKVYFCGRHKDMTSKSGVLGSKGNIYLKPDISRLGPKGEIWFQDGQLLSASDAILYCTGYNFSFPFLRDSRLVSTEGQRVSPLYKHMFVPSCSPTFFFVGIPLHVIPFPLQEYQSKYIARILSGRCKLPPLEEMSREVEEIESKILGGDYKSRHAHYMSMKQFDYVEWLAKACGDDVQPYNPWRKEMYSEARERRITDPESYRDNELSQEILDKARIYFDGLFCNT